MTNYSSRICKLCNKTTNYLFSLEVYKNIQAHYYECEECNTLQSYHLDAMTPNELKNFYESIKNLNIDSGAAWRQYCIVNRIKSLVNLRVIRNSGHKFKVLDFGSGSGFAASCIKFNLGCDVYAYEPYVQSGFSSIQCFKSIDEVIDNGPYNLVIASEVFEHLNEPLRTLNVIRDLLDKKLSYLFITTGLYIPGKRDKNWKYLAAISGQHVIFYSTQSMKKVGQILDIARIYQIGTEYEWLFVKDSSDTSIFSYAYTKTILGALRMFVNLRILPKIE